MIYSRALLFSLILAVTFSLSAPVRAASSIYSDITAATGITRTISSSLAAYAQKRSVQIVTDFSHDQWCCNDAEIIDWNSGYPDPLLEAIIQFMGSPEHRAILLDRGLTQIGCGSTYQSSTRRTYIACEFRRAATAPITPPKHVVTSIPNTAYDSGLH